MIRVLCRLVAFVLSAGGCDAQTPLRLQPSGAILEEEFEAVRA